jgi:hypothetical protein
MDDQELLNHLSRFFLGVFSDDALYAKDVLEGIGVEDVDAFCGAAEAKAKQST